jgi:hypothetical protein
MHFCFWDHLHLSTCLKVIDALQWSPCVSLILHFSPLLLPPSLPPLLLCCCTPPPALGPERRPAALRSSAPRSTRRAALSPTARSARAGHPSSLHVGPMSRAAATPPCEARRCRPPLCVRLRDLSPPFFFLPTAVRCYKSRLSPPPSSRLLAAASSPRHRTTATDLP